MVSDVLFSSESPNWGTPRDFLENLTTALNLKIDLDPCARNAKEAVALNFYNKQANGLVQPWFGNVWCNPPYGREISDWVAKARLEAKNGANVLFICPVRSDTEWFNSLAKRAEKIFFVKSRMSFINLDKPDAPTFTAPFPTCVFKLSRTITNEYGFISKTGKLI